MKTKNTKIPFPTAHSYYTTEQIVINCTLKYALSNNILEKNNKSQ